MATNFDTLLDRRHSDSAKWRQYAEDVLPLWVADMDFRAPEPVLQALSERVEHGVFGYGCEPEELSQVIVDRLFRLYGWKVAPEALILMPGVVHGFHQVCHALGKPGEGILVQPPVYPAILRADEQTSFTCQQAELSQRADGSYYLDLDAFERAITDRTRIFLLCNPHNPVGRVFTAHELKAMADICLRHKMLICSDEIHCDIVYAGHTHIPIGSLSPEIDQQTVTVMAPSKTYNIAGLRLAVAIAPNPELRKSILAVSNHLVGTPSVLSLAAALAAYRDSQPWLDELLAYLQANRDDVVQYVRAHMPGVSVQSPEATFLAWLDCRKAGIAAGTPYDFFLKNAKVALSEGMVFGQAGAGFARLNFGCPRATLREALQRMGRALQAL